MMRSLYSGVSGLKNHQTRMDVIGNNIANVNTVGYKKSRVLFKDTFYQTIRGASAATDARGGTNAMSVGLGMNLSSIDQIHTPAATTTTNKTTDLAVDGNGYFIVSNGGKLYYTRAGAFDFDESGKLVSTSNGYTVQGWNANQDFVLSPSGDVEDINISGFLDMPSRATSTMTLSGNLNADQNFTASRNEVQSLIFGSVPNGGNPGGLFTLSIDGKTTDLIQVGPNGTSTAANIQAALEQLNNIGAGNVSVAWDQSRGRYNIEFKGVLSNTDIPAISFTTPQITETTAGITGSTNEVQTLTLGGAAAGTYTLTYGGFSSTPIAVGASAAAVQTALNNIAYLNGHVTVAASGSDYTITFDNSLGNVDMLGFEDAYTGGTAAITTTTESQMPLSILPVNEVQSLDLSTSAAGSFILSYGGVDTASLAINANAATIQNALNAIPALNGNVQVEEVTAPVAGVSGGTYNITFINGLAGADTDQLNIANTGSSGTVTTKTKGSPAGNPTSAESIITSKDVFDSQGNAITVYYRFFKYEIEPGSNPGVKPVVKPVTRWACDVSLDPLFEKQADYNANADLRSVDISGEVPAQAAGDEKMTRIYNIQFDEQGQIINPDNCNANFSINRQLPTPGAGTANVTVTADFQDLTQFASASSAMVASQDGYAAGKLVSYSIGIDGKIQGTYDNDQTKDLACVALRNFQNPGGLKQVGGTLFQETANSGALPIDAPGINGLGTILPGNLEMSNVDLSEELTDMIITQRGFQANSRIITTSDEMLQELVNLKR